MSRNILVLACSAVLAAGLWLTWRSVAVAGASRVEPREPPAESNPDTATTPVPLLEPPGPGLSSSRTPGHVETETDSRAPVIAAGRVVDDRSEPVGEVLVSTIPDQGEPSVVELPRGRKAAGRRVGHGVTGWGSTDAEGRFEIRAREAPEHSSLLASKEGWFETEPVRFEPGARDLRIVLRRGGTVSGRIVADPGLPLDEIDLLLDCAPAPIDGAANVLRKIQGGGSSFGPDKPRFACKLAGDGSFSFEGICERQARLLFVIQGVDFPTLTIDPVRIAAAGTPSDPSLDPVDLRGKLGNLSFEVIDSAGRKCDGALVALRDPSRRVASRGRTTRGGLATFSIVPGPFDADIEFAGHRRTHLSGITSDQVVHLRRGIPVRIVLEGSAERPRDPYRLVVGLLADIETPCSVVEGHGDFGEGSETAFTVSSPGLHEVGWFLENGGERRFLIGTPRRTVVIGDRDEEQVIRLDLAPEVKTSWELAIRQIEMR